MDKPTVPTRPLEGGSFEHDLVRELRLEVVGGPDAGATFRSRAERTVVGTHRSTDFVLSDPTVSRFHCVLAIEGGRVRVTDLESKNGTRVDGLEIREAWLDGPATLTVAGTRLRLELGGDRVKVPLSTRDRLGAMVGSSRAMRAVFAQLETAAGAGAAVLLEGETGTGKDLAAEAIHRESARAAGPFVIVDCGAIPPALMESELFGHRQGAFTGAHADRAGAFEAASGGTLFLDEVGELDLEVQPKLLRALERHEIRRVGGNEVVPVDVRVIAATNRDLRTEVNARRFRSDLYYRLAVLEIRLPPLRARDGDLPLLVAEILGVLGRASDPAARQILDEKTLAELARHPWPGNVRELRNWVERALTLSEPPPPEVDARAAELPVIDPGQPLRQARERWVRLFERRYLEKLLLAHKNNVAAAARAAGVDRIHLHRLLARAGLR